MTNLLLIMSLSVLFHLSTIAFMTVRNIKRFSYHDLNLEAFTIGIELMSALILAIILIGVILN